MKDNAFDRAMSQIVNEARAEQEKDLRNQRRQILISRLQKAGWLLVVLGILGAAFYYRGEMQGYVSAKLERKSKLEAVLGTEKSADGKTTEAKQGSAASSISKAADNAAKRDAIIEEGLGAK